MAALLATPNTGWIVRQHLGFGVDIAPTILRLLGVNERAPIVPPEGDRARLARLLARTARRHPGDYPIRMANALFQSELRPDPGSYQEVDASSPSMTTREKALRVLERRFGNDPRMCADILRYASQGPLLSHRRETYLFEGIEAPPERGRLSRPTLRQIRSYLDTAERGERLDPGNAYFTAMRAVALFDMKRDAEAFACLSQAASATRWEDYASGEPRGRIALLGAANGDIGAVRRLGLTACTILPHYTRLRAMARIALYRAMVLERNGQVAEGVRIRSDIRRLAALMRDRSTLTIGCLVGIAIGHMAVRRPGGAPDRRGTGAEGEERDALVLRREQAYLQFLRKAGMEAEAGRAASDMAAMQLAHRVLRQVVAPDRWPEVATPSARAAVAALCALVTVAWMLVAALVGIVAALSSRVRAGQPATWAQRLGALWAAVALGLWAADALVPVHSSDMAAAIWCAILLPWLLAAGVCARRRWRRSARSWALAALGGAAVCALLYLVTRAAVLRAGATAGLAVTLSGFSNPEAQAEVARAWIPSLHPLLFVPVLGVALALVLWRRRTPLSVGYARVLASGGPAVICLLMVLYAGYTARQALVEAASSSRLEALIENEVRLLTRETGQDWPVMAQHDATPR